MGDSENGPIAFHTFYRFVWDERAQEGSPDLSPVMKAWGGVS